MDKQRSATITQALIQWREGLQLSRREQSVLGPELQGLDRQLRRLQQRQLRLAVFGRVGVGKSSLINALIGAEALATPSIGSASGVTTASCNWWTPQALMSSPLPPGSAWHGGWPPAAIWS